MSEEYQTDSQSIDENTSDLQLTWKGRVIKYFKAKPEEAFVGEVNGMQFGIIWAILYFFIAIPSCAALVYTNDLWGEYSVLDWVAIIVCSSPLIAFELILGIPPCLTYCKRRIWNLFNEVEEEDMMNMKEKFLRLFGLIVVGGFVPTCWFLSGIFYFSFSPLAFVYIFSTSFGVIEALRQSGIRRKTKTVWQGIAGVDLLIFVLLFAPLDYRWIKEDYFGGPPKMDYDWWALAITVLALQGWLLFSDLPQFGYRLIPTWKDLVVGFGFLFFLGAPVLPIGLLTGFLEWQSLYVPNVIDVFCLWWENVLTVAITEEIFFRVVLMSGINAGFAASPKLFKYNKFGWVGLVFSSVFFGLMHLPRREDLLMQSLYGFFAFISGFVYGGAYLLSGNNIIAAVICHSVTDTVWAFFF